MSMAESKKESLKRWKVFAKVLLHFGNVIICFLLLVALPGLLDGLAGGWGIFYALYAGLGIVCDLQFLLIAMLIWNRAEIKENMLEMKDLMALKSRAQMEDLLEMEEKREDEEGEEKRNQKGLGDDVVFWLQLCCFR